MNGEVKSGSHKSLFLDDDIVQDLQGLRRVLNRPVRGITSTAAARMAGTTRLTLAETRVRDGAGKATASW